MNFGIYIAGLVLFIGAVAFGLSQAGLAPIWVAVVAMAMLGIGIMVAVGKTDPGQEESGRAS